MYDIVTKKEAGTRGIDVKKQSIKVTPPPNPMGPIPNLLQSFSKSSSTLAKIGYRMTLAYFS